MSPKRAASQRTLELGEKFLLNWEHFRGLCNTEKRVYWCRSLALGVGVFCEWESHVLACSHGNTCKCTIMWGIYCKPFCAFGCLWVKVFPSAERPMEHHWTKSSTAVLSEETVLHIPWCKHKVKLINYPSGAGSPSVFALQRVCVFLIITPQQTWQCCCQGQLDPGRVCHHTTVRGKAPDKTPVYG